MYSPDAFHFSVLLFASVQSVYTAFSPTSANNIAVYWGQNSYGASSGGLEQRQLAYYCAKPEIDVIQLAFLNVIDGAGGQPEVNFANAGDNCSTFPGTELLDCPQIATDIASCQQTHGTTILLSIGGATYSEGGFPSPSAAITAANKIWATFGPPQPDSDALRPFGTSSVNGFDFDFESTVSNTAAFATELRHLMDASTSAQPFYLTAAPQCPYPDAAGDPMLNGTVAMDAVFVQFYNNYCGLQSFEPGAPTQTNFNFATWDNWAKTVSLNAGVKVLLGVPAGRTAAGSGYEDPQTLGPILDYCKQFSSFGGVMMWDASQAEANTGFLGAVEQGLG